MTIANYAENFDCYQRREIHRRSGRDRARVSDKFVKSTLKTAAATPFAFNYRLHQAGRHWKIVDVYLNGNISQMAQKRSDFGATLPSVRSAGPGEEDQRAGGSDSRLIPSGLRLSLCAPDSPTRCKRCYGHLPCLALRKDGEAGMTKPRPCASIVRPSFSR